MTREQKATEKMDRIRGVLRDVAMLTLASIASLATFLYLVLR
jgi:hypothetical protein